MAPYPVAHYPTLPPVGRCSCAPCSRRRRMSVLRAALPAMSGLAAYANAVSVAGRLCEDTPAAKIEKAIALTGAICQMPLAISESLARIGREHRLARDVWADRQRGILKGESLVDPKGTKEIADMLARFKEDRGISDEVKPPVVIQTRQLAAEGKVYSGTEVLRGDWPQDEPSMSDALDSMERQIYTQRERPVQMVSAEKFRRLHRMNDDDDR